jgi:uncharacterized membrane protein (GlpM family)
VGVQIIVGGLHRVLPPGVTVITYYVIIRTKLEITLPVLGNTIDGGVAGLIESLPRFAVIAKNLVCAAGPDVAVFILKIRLDVSMFR